MLILLSAKSKGLYKLSSSLLVQPCCALCAKFTFKYSNSCFLFFNKKYHTVGKVPKSNTKIAERDKTDTQTHDHCPGLIQAGQNKVAGLCSFYGSKLPSSQFISKLPSTSIQTIPS